MVTFTIERTLLREGEQGKQLCHDSAIVAPSNGVEQRSGDQQPWAWKSGHLQPNLSTRVCDWVRPGSSAQGWKGWMGLVRTRLVFLKKKTTIDKILPKYLYL